MFFKKNIVTAVHFTGIFTTIDGKEHKDPNFLYVNPNRLTISVQDYLTAQIIANKYMTDEENIVYPLVNIVSIHWILDSMINVKDDNWKIFYSDSEAID